MLNRVNKLKFIHSRGLPFSSSSFSSFSSFSFLSSSSSSLAATAGAPQRFLQTLAAFAAASLAVGTAIGLTLTNGHNGLTGYLLLLRMRKVLHAAAAAAAPSVVDQADQLYTQGKTVDLYNLLSAAVKRDPSNGAQQWRFARAAHDLAALVCSPPLP